MELSCAKHYVRCQVHTGEWTGLHHHHHLHPPSEQLTSAKPYTLAFCYY